MLQEDVKNLLLKTARDMIECSLIDDGSCEKKILSSELVYRRYPELFDHCGVFVTLKISDPVVGEGLRGCIGSIIGRESLYEGVKRFSSEAAFNDPRFNPVTEDELSWITIEISVLTPPERALSTDDIVLGQDGVILNYQGRVAVFLPQVATEEGWDKATMLQHLSLKAGLPEDTWKDPDCFFTIFQAEIFSEEE